jgi:hypothetical protein
MIAKAVVEVKSDLSIILWRSALVTSIKGYPYTVIVDLVSTAISLSWSDVQILGFCDSHNIVYHADLAV